MSNLKRCDKCKTLSHDDHDKSVIDIGRVFYFSSSSRAYGELHLSLDLCANCAKEGIADARLSLEPADGVSELA